MLAFTDQCDGRLVGGDEVRDGRVRWADLRHTHLAEDIDSELLEAADVDGPLFSCGQIAPADAEVAGWTHHSAGEAERVVA